MQVVKNLSEQPLTLQIVYSKCLARICLTLKVKEQVTKCNERNDAIRWQISKSINIINFCVSSHHFREINIYQLSTLKT